jgi:predicted anti-sigma-YlaC factor YlaD
MKCHEIEELLPEFINGTVDKSSEKEVFEHLLICESCRKELAFWIEIADCNKAQKIELTINKITKEKLIKEETSTFDLAKKAVQIYFKVLDQII